MQLAEEKRISTSHERIAFSEFETDTVLLKNQISPGSLRQCMAEVGVSWIKSTSPDNYLPNHGGNIWRTSPGILIGTEMSRYERFRTLGMFPEVNPLEEFQRTVDASSYILELEDGWDDNTARAIDRDLYRQSASCISKYIESIFFQTGVVITSPTINPLSNGTLDYEWSGQSARFLMNFRIDGDSVKAFYYGDLYNNRLPIKGSVPCDKVYDHLMKWMENLK